MFGRKKKEEIRPREDGLTDYNIYIMSRQEKIANIIFAAVVLFLVGYVLSELDPVSDSDAFFCEVSGNSY